jgi:RND family efflux transporter MFP subunit
VRVTRPQRAAIAPEEVFVARTEASEVVEVRARVAGFLEEQLFVDGSFVEKDAVLYRLERGPFVSALERAKASLEVAKAERVRAEAEYERAQRAVASSAVSLSEASLRLADRDKAFASVASAEAAVRAAELDLGYTEIRSPIAGRIDRSLVSVGNLVGSGTSTLLTTIYRVQPIYAYFELPERDVVEFLRRRAAGGDAAAEKRAIQHPVELQLEGDAGFPHAGAIDFVASSADSGTGTVVVRAALPNEQRRIMAGLFSRVRIRAAEAREELLVPETAIGIDLAGKHVLVLDEQNLVQRVGIEVGARSGTSRVVQSGLRGDERVLVEGQVKVRPGFPARAEEAAAATPPAAR